MSAWSPTTLFLSAPPAHDRAQAVCPLDDLSGRQVVVVPGVIWAGLDRVLLSSRGARPCSLSAESLCSCSAALDLVITLSSYF